MKTPAPHAVGDLLSNALPQISDRLLALRIRQTWASIVGRDAARRARPDTLSGETLRIVVDNSPWLHELTLRAGELTTKIRERFPEVQTLQFVLGALEGEAATASAKVPRAVTLTAADHADIDAAAAAISDSGLSEAARRLLVAARRFPRTQEGSRGAV